MGEVMPVWIKLPSNAYNPMKANDCPKCGCSNNDLRLFCRSCEQMLPRGVEKGLPKSWKQQDYANARTDLAMLHDPSPGNLCYMDGYYAKSLEQKYGIPTSELAKIVGLPKFTTTMKWD